MFIDFSKMLIVRDIEAPQIPPHIHTQAHMPMCAHDKYLPAK